MRSKKGMRIGIILTLALTVLFHPLVNAPSIAAPLAQDIVLSITAPTEGSTLSGIVSVQGTATHPHFVKYGVLYATGTTVSGNTTWRLETPIAWDVTTMVVNGELGQWDTTTMPNGQYVLALVVYEAGNDTPHVHFVNNLTILNEEATATPEPSPTPQPVSGDTPEPTAPEPPGEEGAAVPTVEQPATATPRPTPTLGPELESTPEDDTGINPADILSGAAVKQAFITGAWLALFLYILGAFYVIIKAVVRYYLRQLKRQQNQQHP